MLAYLVSPANEQSRFAEIKKTLAKRKCKFAHLPTLEELKNALLSEPKATIAIIADSIISTKDIDSLFSTIPKGIYVFYISDKISPTDYKNITRSGSAESTDWSSAASDIDHYLEIISTGDSSSIVTQDVLAKQIVVSFVGTGSGAGNTTMAMEAAIDLAVRSKSLRHGSVAFLDLDLEGGPVCDYLGVEARLDLNEIAVNPRRLDSYMLEIMSSKHPSGLDIFSTAKPYVISRYKSQDHAILSLLNCVVDNYSITLLDIPNYCPIETDEILKNSDLIFCTGVFSVPAAKRLKILIGKLMEQEIPKDKISIILTDTDTNLMGGISLRFNIETVFKGWQLYYTRRDRPFALECVDAGVSMIQTQPRKGISQDIQKLSDRILQCIKNS